MNNLRIYDRRELELMLSISRAKCILLDAENKRLRKELADAQCHPNRFTSADYLQSFC
jgi:hypothetical protein